MQKGAQKGKSRASAEQPRRLSICKGRGVSMRSTGTVAVLQFRCKVNVLAGNKKGNWAARSAMPEHCAMSPFASSRAVRCPLASPCAVRTTLYRSGHGKTTRCILPSHSVHTGLPDSHSRRRSARGRRRQQRHAACTSSTEDCQRSGVSVTTPP